MLRSKPGWDRPWGSSTGRPPYAPATSCTRGYGPRPCWEDEQGEGRQRAGPPSILFVAANRLGEASQCVAAKRGGLNCDAREVDEDTPEMAGCCTLNCGFDFGVKQWMDGCHNKPRCSLS